MSSGRTSPISVTVRVYRPDSRFNDNAFSATKHLAAELWNHRAHIALMFVRDFRASYRGTALGVFWNFVLPVLPVSVYVFLSMVGVFPLVEGLPRAVFVSFNVTLWLLFSGLVEKPIDVVRARNADAMKTSLPISVAIAASFASLAFDTAVRLVFVLGVCLATLTAPGFLLPLLIPLLIVGILFSLSLGLVCAILNIVLPDTRKVVTIFMRYGIFVSGVIFPLSSIKPLHWLDYVNPFAILIHATRDLTFGTSLTYPIPSVVLTLLTFLLLLFSFRLFYLMEYRIRGVI